MRTRCRWPSASSSLRSRPRPSTPRRTPTRSSSATSSDLNPVYLETFKTVNANPVPMAFGELFTALETKTVDAQENPYSIILGNKFRSEPGVPGDLQDRECEPGADGLRRALHCARDQDRRRPGEPLLDHPRQQVPI